MEQIKEERFTLTLDLLATCTLEDLVFHVYFLSYYISVLKGMIFRRRDGSCR